MFLGTHRFDQLLQHLGIARNILAARLRRLVEHGILSRRLYHDHPPRFEYHLTRKGVDLYPVVVGLMQWGDRYLAGAAGGPVVLEHATCGHQTELVPTCSACGEPIDPREMRALPR
jgi:DNA-binding HxlR family transcriptional regulator